MTFFRYSTNFQLKSILKNISCKGINQKKNTIVHISRSSIKKISHWSSFWVLFVSHFVIGYNNDIYWLKFPTQMSHYQWQKDNKEFIYCWQFEVRQDENEALLASVISIKGGILYSRKSSWWIEKRLSFVVQKSFLISRISSKVSHAFYIVEAKKIHAHWAFSYPSSYVGKSHIHISFISPTDVS